MVLNEELSIKTGDKVFILREPDILGQDNNHTVAVVGYVSKLEKNTNDLCAKITPFVVGSPDGRFLFTNCNNIPYYSVKLSEQGLIVTKDFKEHKNKIINEERGYQQKPKQKRVDDYLERAENLKNTQ
ncbi:MAG: hypothetical protein JSW73_02725 [Candidatus Woesearchaeota archaeon]|nr:MAG: hypothetical protein JSW73_02725 [Candidatus Woesearchaeota archaeon]